MFHTTNVCVYLAVTLTLAWDGKMNFPHPGCHPGAGLSDGALSKKKVSEVTARLSRLFYAFSSEVKIASILFAVVFFLDTASAGSFVIRARVTMIEDEVFFGRYEYGGSCAARMVGKHRIYGCNPPDNS